MPCHPGHVNNDDDDVAVVLIKEDNYDHISVPSMCQVSKFHESLHLILLEMGSFIIPILQTKQRVVKKVAEDYTDLSGRAGTLCHRTLKVILLITPLYCLPLNIKGTRKKLAGSRDKCEPGLLDKRRPGLHLGPGAHPIGGLHSNDSTKCAVPWPQENT